METGAAAGKWKTLLAFAIIYFVWGSTYLAIRVGVHEIPPLLMAAIRFLIAGALLFAWASARGERVPRGAQWRPIFFLGFLIFVLDYGLLFWAEQRVPSGVAAVMMATIPAFMALSEIALLGTQRFTARLAFAWLTGLAGVAVLVNPSLSFGGKPVSWLGAGALLIAALSWSIGSALTRKLDLPPSRTMSAGTQMLAGGLLLGAAASAFGELHGFHPLAVSAHAWFALLYLIVAGSLTGFTAYLWLIHHQSPTKVGTYAYVNPVVAVLLGYFLGGEALTWRTVAGTVFVLSSVVLITTARTVPATVKPAVE